MAEKWAVTYNAYVPRYCLGNDNPNETVSTKLIADYIRENKLVSIEKFDIRKPEDVIEEYLEKHTQEELDQLYQKVSLPFLRSYVTLMREIIRLRMLKSDKFDEALKAALTAQDFKEASYKLMKIDSEKRVNAIMRSLENHQIHLGRAQWTLNMALDFRIPVEQLDELIGFLKKMKDDPTCTREDAEWIDSMEQQFNTRKDHWIRPR